MAVAPRYPPVAATSQLARFQTGSSTVDQSEIGRVQAYMREKFNRSDITVHQRAKKDDSAEVTIGGEFVGVIFKDDEDGEVSYDFHMAIMDVDLPPKA